MALRNISVIELAGLAPAPFCGKILADFGAKVTRVDGTDGRLFELDRLSHGKKSFAVNLKDKRGVEIMKKMTLSSDVLIDPYRPGILEKLDLGPSSLMSSNSRLIVARLSGFGQAGPLKNIAGHDINYLAISGILSFLGRKESPPTPPANLLADFAGGGLLCALGITMAIIERGISGKGQIIDANMVAGSAYVGSWLFATQDLPMWGKPRGYNWLDSGVHFYNTYETKDGKYIAVGAIEPQFYSVFLSGLGLTIDEVPQDGNFDECKKIISEKFKEKTRDEWWKIFEGTDACVTPVLDKEEAPVFPHNFANKFFFKDKFFIPSPAPRFSDESEFDASRLKCPNELGEHTVETMSSLGYSAKEIELYLNDGVILQGKGINKL